MIVKAGWFFEQDSAMGDAAANAYRNPLAGVGVPESNLFECESIHDNVDASTGFAKFG